MILTKIDIDNILAKSNVVHATYLKFWPFIKEEGLKLINRNHIYLRPW
jgi:RNA:NAD 2'-phosphotransferase (TPT1/KptA family)